MEKKLLWTQTGLAAATGGSIMRPFNITGISIDSRDVSEGDLFIAIKNKKDGHYFLKNAAQNGASAAMIAWKPKNLPSDLPVIFVRNTEDALRKLAAAARSRMRGKVIAITGTAGKTSTKDMMNKLLQEQGLVHASKASLNNHWGVPLSLARMPAETDYGIFEIGMNHKGEITPLSKMVRPDVAIITSVGAGHIEFFNSEEEIATAKAEIFSGVKQGGTVILNRDNRHYDFLAEQAKTLSLTIVSFGEHESADIRIQDIQVGEAQTHFSITVAGVTTALSVPIVGKHYVWNIAAIIGALEAVGVSLETVKPAFADLKESEGRGNMMVCQLANGQEFSLMNESYNANPLSMKAALDRMAFVKSAQGGLKIAVIGEMRELGKHAIPYHLELKEAINAAGFDRIYLVGGEPVEALYDALGDDSPSICAGLLEDIMDEIITETVAGSVVFIKASNSIGLSQLVKKYQGLYVPEVVTESSLGGVEVLNTPLEISSQVSSEVSSEVSGDIVADIESEEHVLQQ